jgi:hypothetical protein
VPIGTPLWRADTSSDNTLEEQQQAVRDITIAKRIGEHLDSHYPSHKFRVDVDSPQGIAKISHPLLPKRWFYVIKLSELFMDPGLKCVMRAGGELLDRFNMPRGRFNRDLWREASTVTYANLKHGIFELEYNAKTGQVRKVIPDALAV